MSEHNRTPQIILLGFAGCPNLAPTRAALVEALQAAGLPGDGYSEYDTETDVCLNPCPDALRSWPSPTILINGFDIEGALPSASNACRVYDSETGAPTIAIIAAALSRTGGRA